MQGMFRSILFLLSLSISSSLFATSENPFDGLYVGGQVGSSFTSGQQLISGAAIADVAGGLLISTTLPIRLESQIVKNTWIGSFFAGYGHSWRRLYLGGEIGLTASNYQMRNTLDTGLQEALLPTTPFSFEVDADAHIVTKATISPIQFTAALRPGLMLTKSTLLFARIGLSLADITYEANTKALTGTSFLGLPEIVIPTTLHPSTSHQSAFFQTGAGLEQNVTENWSVRIDYLCTYYGTLHANKTKITNFTLDLDDQPIPATFTVIGNNRIKLSSQAVLIGVVGHFNF